MLIKKIRRNLKRQRIKAIAHYRKLKTDIQCIDNNEKDVHSQSKNSMTIDTGC